MDLDRELTVEKVLRTGDNNDNILESTGEIMLINEVKPFTIEEQFTLRPTQMVDLDGSVDLFTTCSMHMIGQNEAALSEVRNEWLLPEFDLENATRVAVTSEGKIVGYIEVWDIDETPVRIWVWGRVHPDFEGLGIGSQLMQWAEQRARYAISRVPDGIQVAMQAGSYSTYKPALHFLRDFGMSPIRSFYTMAVELDHKTPQPTVPPGITIRTFSGKDDLRDIVFAVRDAFKDHWGYVHQPFEQEYKRWRHFIEHDEDYDPSLWFLAVDGEEIAGISLCNPESSLDSNMGWVSTLGVCRPWRRQGLGLALLHHSFEEFFQRGKARVGLGVDASSLTGATRLYERAGMREIRQFNTLEKVLRPGRDISTQEVAK
ncbi:MAG TPA: GNAT family N-acetyltransferase [Patescibacteria group bacterium]|nr:GNAT family N-acetyltransferase [Patescibacteria group bacterium]